MKDRVAFFYGLRCFVVCDRIFVLCGDFYCVIRTADRSPSRQRTDRSITVLSDLIDDFDWVDAGTVINETSEIRFTHFQVSSHARLDSVRVGFCCSHVKKVPRHACLFFGSLFYFDNYRRKDVAEAIQLEALEV